MAVGGSYLTGVASKHGAPRTSRRSCGLSLPLVASPAPTRKDAVSEITPSAEQMTRYKV